MNKLFLAISTSIAIILASCSSDYLTENSETLNSYEVLYLPDNVDFSNLSPNEKTILMAAIYRMKICENDDGLYEIGVKSAKEINISDNIFEYINRSIKYYNEQLIKLCGRYRNSIISRSSNFKVNVPSASLAMEYALESNGKEASSFLIAEASNNMLIPLNEFFSILKKFSPNVMCVSPEYFTSNEVLNDKVIIVYSIDNNNIGRAANGNMITTSPVNGNMIFMTTEHQFDGTTFPINQNYIEAIYICE